MLILQILINNLAAQNGVLSWIYEYFLFVDFICLDRLDVNIGTFSGRIEDKASLLAK